MYDVINREANNYNTHVAQYLNSIKTTLRESINLYSPLNHP